MKHIPTLIIIVLCHFLWLSNAYARFYPDVPANHKHYVAISNLTEGGIIKGYPNGEFHPSGLINRAEAVKILIGTHFESVVIENALDWHKRLKHQYAIFPDVPVRKWFSKYVEVSFQNQIVHGYPDGLFRPGDNINFAEALKVIFESYDVDFSDNQYITNPYVLVDQGEWYEKYFTYAQMRNLLNKNKVYHPGQYITRGEFVEIMYRLDYLNANNIYAFPDPGTAVSGEYRITIPALGIINVDVSLANLYDTQQALNVLKNGLGHYLATPDQGKKMVLFGHSSGYSWDPSNYKTILREIDRLNEGDRIYINYQEKGYIYEIYKKEIIPASQDYQLIENEHNNELALYTCWPPNSISKRYVVYGKPV
jgi:LPXTG-site transpeptidase (sortase) family protein